MAISYYNRGLLRKDTGWPKEAEADLEAARAIFKQLVAEFPTRPEYKLELAECHNIRCLLRAAIRRHEVWLKLADASVEWQDRSHFLRTAATAMRRILVDRARAKQTAKRDTGRRVELEDVPAPLRSDELLALDAALEKLAAFKPDHARLVELRYFAGQTGDEAAAALNVSPATADRMWRFARAWLQVEMTTD